jgi:hypothetical protein
MAGTVDEEQRTSWWHATLEWMRSFRGHPLLAIEFYSRLRAGTIGEATDILTANDTILPAVKTLAPLASPKGWAVPTLHSRIGNAPEIVMAEGDKVAVSWTITGKHTGIVACRQPAAMLPQGVNIFRVEDGRIAEIWNFRNDLWVLQQIGAVALNF